MKLDQSTLGSYLTGYACATRPETVIAYDYYSLGGGAYSTGAATRSNIDVLPITISSTTTAIQTSSPGPIPTTSPKGGLTGGAIAGIVIGGIGGILIALGMFFLYRFLTRRSRERRAQPADPLVQSFAALPPNNRPPMMSIPSNTPLTHGATSELTPDDSASHIGGYSSALPHASSPDVFSGTNSYPTTHPPSALGPLPQFPAGPGAQSVTATQSVMSPGSAFGSMPPVHAPDVPPESRPGA
ncbi:MAG: hypothetical protein Q9217_006312 [Psora testacea]